MKCRGCGYKVFIDRVFSSHLRVELFCLGCGKRWFISKDNAFGKWLDKNEKSTRRKLGIFT